MNQQFTNELTPEVLHSLRNPFSAQQIEGFGDAREQIMRSVNDRANTPILAVYRLACEGALTREGGVLQESPTSQCKTQLDDGDWRRYGLVGDNVVYPDGSTARIISGTGKYRVHNGKSMALVGSLLDNGDVIISTPKDGRFLVEYEGTPFGHDFLKAGV